jgi:hypothetical protein
MIRVILVLVLASCLGGCTVAWDDTAHGGTKVGGALLPPCCPAK